MILLKLAIKSLWNRKVTFFLTVLSMAMSVALLLSVERTRRASEEGFTQTISQTDLIVGARSGPVNLLLYTVFNMGSATNNISWETYEHYRSHPSVDWVIPFSLGDGHQGFRVVATNENFYLHYRFRGDQRIQFALGGPAVGLWDVVLGSEVHRKLGYQLGDKVVVTHGVTRGKGIQDHDDKPFRVVGIMKPTGTALDMSLYITMQGMEGIHLDWQSGAAPTRETAIRPEEIKPENIKVDQLTAFFLRTKSRIETLRLQREINTYQKEPLLAIIPGVVLSEVWRGLSYFEKSLKMISWMVMAVGFAAILISLLTGLNERRREMAILRAIGSSPMQIAFLFVFECSLITLCGVLLGTAVELSGFVILKNYLESELGLYLVGAALGFQEIVYLIIALIIGFLVGLIPALRAHQLSLKDGLTMKL